MWSRLNLISKNATVAQCVQLFVLMRCLQWLTKKHSPAKIAFAIKELRNQGILHEYPPLIEVNKGLVSQSEHTVIIRDKPIITTSREE